MSEENDDLEYWPQTTNMIGIPNDKNLLTNYKVYKVSKETHNLLTEQGRSVYAEAFFDKYMKTLSDICLDVLANSFGPAKLPSILKNDPLKLRVFYDTLSIDLPLEKIYCITDEEFWKRVATFKTKNKFLLFNKNINWKNRGISEKLRTRIESIPAEYWPAEEIQDLAAKIKYFVTELHLKRLQSLTEESFRKYFQPKNIDSSSSEEESVAEESEESIDWNQTNLLLTASEHSETYSEGTFDSRDLDVVKEEPVPPTYSQLQIEQIEEEIRETVKAAFIAKIEAKKLAKMENELRLQQKLEKKLKDEEQAILDAAQSKKRRRRKKYESLFDIPLPDDDDDIASFDQNVDRRNPEQLLQSKKVYNYPPEHCHHIDLSFFRWFDHLETIWIEFLGPPMQRDFHPRHLNFSYNDIKNLCTGIASLEMLRTFRLRNSKMDAKKFEMLMRTLQGMDSIEIVDFGNNSLHDDCALTIYKYFQNAKGVLSLELEGNFFRSDFLKKMAYGLYQYTDRKMEYIGLASTKPKHDGFHELTQVLINTGHVKTLNLKGSWLDDTTIYCCIAESLIRKHKTMENINLMAVSINEQESIDLVKALRDNQTLKDFNIRGCGIGKDIEYEIEVILRRNAYIKGNIVFGNEQLTEKEIQQHIKTKKNPLLGKVLEKFEEQKLCIKNRALVASEEIIHPQPALKIRTSIKSETNSNVSRISFNYDANSFNHEQFIKHVDIPGPGQRYFYLKKQRRNKHEIDLHEL